MKKALHKFNHPTVFVGAGLLITFVVLMIWLPGELWRLPIQTYDTPAHLNYIREILDKGFGAALELKFEGGFYPPLFHLIGAGFTPMLGGSVVSGATATWLLGAWLIFPLGMVWFVRSLIRHNYLKFKLSTNVVYLTTIILSTSFAVFPYLFLNVGTLYSYGFAMAFTPWVLAFGIDFLYQKNLRSALSCLTAGLLMCLAQPRAVFATAIIALPFIIQYLVMLYKKDRKLFRKVVIGLASTALIAIAAVGFYVATRLKSSLLFHPGSWFPGLDVHAGWLDSTWQYVSGAAWYMSVDWFFAAVLLVILIVNIVCYKKLKTGKFLISWLIFGLLYVLAASGDFALAKLVSAPWYKNPWRIIAVLPVVIIPMILAAVNLLVKKVGRVRIISALFVVLGLSLLIFNSGNYQIRWTLIQQTATDNPYAMLSDQKIATFAAVRDQTGANSIVIADPFTGAPLAYALTGQALLFSIQNPRLDNSADMVNMLAGWSETDIDRICAVRPDQTKYFLDLGAIYTDFDPIYHTYNIFHDATTRQDFLKRGWLTTVKQFASGQAEPFTLYKINCN